MAHLFKDSHVLAFWGNHIPPKISAFALSPHQDDDCPPIFVVLSQQGMSVCLSYFIKHTSWLNWSKFDPKQMTHHDYLWQDNCLECFFELNHSQGYLEINLAPNGAFATYAFTDYRTPNTLPPPRDDRLSLYHIPKHAVAGWHTYHVGIKFNEYFAKSPCQISKIHPAAILYHDGEPIFYAIRHASPPDFHDKKYWQVFKKHSN